MDMVVNRKALIAELQKHKVEWMTGRRVTEIYDDGVKAIDMRTGEILRYHADTCSPCFRIKTSYRPFGCPEGQSAGSLFYWRLCETSNCKGRNT